MSALPKDKTKEVITELGQIGFSLYEARAYLSLLATQPVNGYDLAKLSGIPSSKIYETLKRLVIKGAVLPSASQPTLYRTVPPEVLIASVRQQTEHSLGFLASALPGLAVAPSVSMIWRLGDQEGIVRELQGIVTNALKEVYLSIWPPEAAHLVKPVKLARQRGVRFWVASFGPSPLTGKGIYDLLSCGASSAARLGKRLAAAVADDKQVLIAEFRDDAEPTGTFADDPPLALVTKEYIIHDLINHALISELGYDRFAALREQHPLISGLLGPAV